MSHRHAPELAALALALLVTLGAAAAAAPTAPAGDKSDPLDGFRFPAFSAEEREELEAGEPYIRVESAPDSDIKTGHVIAIFPYSLDQVRGVVEDLDHLKDFLPDLLESKILEPDKGEGCLFRCGIDCPWPVDNRFWTVRIKMADVVAEGVRNRVHRWEYVAGSGNINSTTGHWIMRPYDRDASKTIVSYFVHTDPGGWIPDFIVNFATKTYLPDLVGALRERLTEVCGAPGKPVAAKPAEKH